MRVSLRWSIILFLAFVTACAPAASSSVLSITRLPDYVDALEVEATVSGLTIKGKTNLRDDVCLRTRLLQDDRPVAWWPDECFFAFGGRLRVNVPFGKAGVPAALESQARYVFQIEVRDAPAVRDTLAFDLADPPTSIAASNTKTPSITTSAPTATPQVTVTSVVPPSPVPIFDASLPFVRYLSGNRLIEQDARGGQRVLAELPEAGEIKQAVQVNDDILIWRAQGIQRVTVASGNSALVVVFNQPALFGNLIAAPNGRTLVYAVSQTNDCSATGLEIVIGQYRLDTGATRTIFTAPLVKVLGLTNDGSTLFLQPVGCDPEFGELWTVSLLTGKVTATLPAQAEVEKYVGFAEAWLSTGARYLAFGAHRVAGEAAFEEAVGLYDFALSPPALTWLAIPPNIVWLNDTRWLYYLQGNTLFRYELKSGQSLELGAVPISVTRLRYTTSDGNWLVLTDEAMSRIVFFDLKQKIALEAALLAEQPVVLVMPQ
ncbi:MAG: hypothetical protein ACT4QE_17835 [Anaerolineales bacterium]